MELPEPGANQRPLGLVSDAGASDSGRFPNLGWGRIGIVIRQVRKEN